MHRYWKVYKKQVTQIINGLVPYLTQSSNALLVLKNDTGLLHAFLGVWNRLLESFHGVGWISSPPHAALVVKVDDAMCIENARSTS